MSVSGAIIPEGSEEGIALESTDFEADGLAGIGEGLEEGEGFRLLEFDPFHVGIVWG